MKRLSVALAFGLLAGPALAQQGPSTPTPLDQMLMEQKEKAESADRAYQDVLRNSANVQGQKQDPWGGVRESAPKPTPTTAHKKPK